MISKNQIKIIQSLNRKKKRDELKLFVAEGEKTVKDLLPFFTVKYLFSTVQTDVDAEVVSHEEMKKITHLSTASNLLAVFEQRHTTLDHDIINTSLSLVLDDVQDPGNLGTIIRVADWFGIKNVFCSKHSVDVYNSKTIMSTMGALSRVNVHYIDLELFLSTVDLPIFGTFMDGDDIYNSQLSSHGLIIMGNEGNGISKDVEEFVTHRLTIPSFGDKSSESLNVAMATGIVCSEFRRK